MAWIHSRHRLVQAIDNGRPRRSAYGNVAAVFSVVLCTLAPANASNFADLKSDWSNAANPHTGPNGTWAYTHSGVPLPFIDHWAGYNPLGGWGPAGNVPGDFLPFFFKNTAPFEDSLPNDVVVHTTDGFNGAGNGIAAFIWTSAMTGTVTINGSLWPTRLISRQNFYELTLVHNSLPTSLASGTVVEDGSLSRCHPIRFSLPGIAIVPGDQVQLLLQKIGAFGDFAGVNLSISTGNCSHAPGDLNGDTLRDGEDVVQFVNCLLAGTAPCGDCACADMDGSGVINGADVPLFIASVL